MFLGLFLKIFWIVVILLVVFGFWFLPKYRYLREHPDRCVQVSGNFYYCGRSTQIDRLFSLPEETQQRIKDEIRARFEQGAHE